LRVARRRSLLRGPSSAQTPITSFTYVSQPGDYIGQGTKTLLAPEWSFSAAKNRWRRHDDDERMSPFGI
jgi:hypothetical protein